MKRNAPSSGPLSLLFLVTSLFGVTQLRADLFVLQPGNGSGAIAVFRFDEKSGAFLNQFSAETEGFAGITKGPDNRIYVTSNILGLGDVYRFTADGQFMGKFVHGGNLTIPGPLVFGPDGNLYVGSIVFPGSPNQPAGAGQILRYNGANGSFLDTFVSPGSGGLSNPVQIVFCRNGVMAVADLNLGIFLYSASDGAFLGVLIPAGRGGLTGITGLALGLDGNVYVSSRDLNAVLRFNGTTGAFLGYFVAPGSGGLDNPGGLTFGPDNNLYVSSRNTGSVLRYNGASGAFMDAFIPPQSGGLRSPTQLVFASPAPRLRISRSGSHVVLSWPNSFTNFSLTAAQSLQASGSWTVVTQKPSVIGSELVVTNSVTAPATFFRLRSLPTP
jgi:outer membrane protein assembly factor BamB